MDYRLLSGFLLATMIVLYGCDSRTPSGMNAIASADAQRHKVIISTRAASYSVFPDTDDPEKLKDDTFLDAMHAESPNGSAIAVRADGLVTTNMHVIKGTNFCTGPSLEERGIHSASEEDVLRETGRAKEEAARRAGIKETHCIFVNQAFTKAFRAKLVKIDEVHDVVLLCLLKPERQTPFIELSSAGSITEGMEVFTIGSPFGNTNMLTHGYLSNLNFTPRDKETGKKGVRKIQFTAYMLPGNSGGPLVSVATGKLVGQVVATYIVNDLFTGMSYANPVEDLRKNISDTPPCND